MKLKSLSKLIPLLVGVSLAAQDSEIISTGLFDTGRLRSTPEIDFHAFAQWNGENDNPGNVGWNEQGVWWSFARFGSGSSSNVNPDLFNKLDSAGEIYLHLGVLWNEIDATFVGIIEPGVTVGVYLVPGLAVPDGELPTFTTAWPYQYANQIKLFEIDPATVATTNSSWSDFQLSPPTLEQRIENLQPYDITSGIKSAIQQGLLDDSTPWGLVFFPEELLPGLTTNNPEWLDKRGTVLDIQNMRVEFVSGGGATWAGLPVDSNGNVDTENLVGWINVSAGDWVWSYSLSKYLYLPESLVTEGGSWTYIPK